MSLTSLRMCTMPKSSTFTRSAPAGSRAGGAVGPAPDDPRAIGVEQAAQVEALGAAATRWRAARATLDCVEAGHAAQRRALGALDDRRDAVQATLDALENEARGAARRLQLRAMTAGAEIAELLAALDGEGEAAREMLRAHPVARGLLGLVDAGAAGPN